MKLFFDNGNQRVSGDGAPDLRLRRMHAVTDEMLNARMLFDLLEEQFDASAAQPKRKESQ